MHVSLFLPLQIKNNRRAAHGLFLLDHPGPPTAPAYNHSFLPQHGVNKDHEEHQAPSPLHICIYHDMIELYVYCMHVVFPYPFNLVLNWLVHST